MKLPPYGKIFQRYPSKNNGIVIFCGTGSWQRAKKLNGSDNFKLKYGACCVVYPSKTLPENYDWKFVNGLEVAIIHNARGIDRIDGQILNELAVCLVKAGASMVIILDSCKGISPTYRPRIAA